MGSRKFIIEYIHFAWCEIERVYYSAKEITQTVCFQTYAKCNRYHNYAKVFPSKGYGAWLLLAKKVVLLENVKDLGNLGTILRTSTAFGAEALVLYGRECADIYNPKCVRSSVGNLWKIPVVYIESFDELQKYFAGFNCVATLPHASSYLKDFKAQLPLLVMFGSEADGLSDEMIGFSTDSVKIEMASSVESLNLSVSCAVVLYKLFL